MTMYLEDGDLLVVSISPVGGPYACPSIDDWWATTESIDEATDFTVGAADIEAAFRRAGMAASALGGRPIRIPANQIPGGA